MTPHHVPNMQFSGFIVGHIKYVVAFTAEVRQYRGFIVLCGNLQAHVYVGFVAPRDAIIELCNAALAKRPAETQKAALPFFDGHRQDHFAVLTDLSTLRDMPKPAEVHIGATYNRYN